MTIHISQFVTELGVPLSGSPPPPVMPPVAETARFDAGLGNTWYLVPQLTDSGGELRDKVIKAFRATGKMTVPQFSVYAYGPEKEINVTDIEDGVRSSSGKKPLPSTTQVVQSARKQINVPNAMLHTVRLEGTWDGTGMKDRIDEIVYEVAQQGIRR
jgi:hypothetical protein